MASDRATLKVDNRSEFGSRTTRRLRRQGLVPGVVYGGRRDTRQLSALIPPEDVEFIADEPDEVTIATLSPPRVEEEPEPEVEEEAELVGEEGEEPEAAEGEAPEPEAEDGEQGERE